MALFKITEYFKPIVQYFDMMYILRSLLHGELGLSFCLMYQGPPSGLPGHHTSLLLVMAMARGWETIVMARGGGSIVRERVLLLGGGLAPRTSGSVWSGILAGRGPGQDWGGRRWGGRSLNCLYSTVT